MEDGALGGNFLDAAIATAAPSDDERDDDEAALLLLLFFDAQPLFVFEIVISAAASIVVTFCFAAAAVTNRHSFVWGSCSQSMFLGGSGNDSRVLGFVVRGVVTAAKPDVIVLFNFHIGI